MEAFEKAIGHKCIGNKPASGTVILEELGAQHLRDHTPIVYTSGDSVFQIACHEELFPPGPGQACRPGYPFQRRKQVKATSPPFILL